MLPMSASALSRHAQCAGECRLLGGKADDDQPLLTNLNFMSTRPNSVRFYAKEKGANRNAGTGSDITRLVDCGWEFQRTIRTL
jgi:hypothetical protein